MPARTGQQYIKGLQQQEREVWLRGERVEDVTPHPGLRNGVRAVAALYDMQQYLATDTVGARDRVKLFRLAWDIAGSAFGSRQVLYERFFASDPLTRARILNAIYPKDEVMKRVLDFLGRSDDASETGGM